MGKIVRVTFGNKGSKILYINNKRYKIIKNFLNYKKTIDEYISNKKNLDVEFAINKQNKVFILQIRALNYS